MKCLNINEKNSTHYGVAAKFLRPMQFQKITPMPLQDYLWFDQYYIAPSFILGQGKNHLKNRIVKSLLIQCMQDTKKLRK
jgi:hypothetical protein